MVFVRFLKEDAVSQQAFDALTRRAAGSITRRSSLVTLGAAGLAALAGTSLTVEAKDKTKKKLKNLKKELAQSNQKCSQQVTDCETFVAALGGNAAQVECCSLLTTCDFSAFNQCLLG
jgi:hypothetical protein